VKQPIKDGWIIFIGTNKLLAKYPLFLFPIFITWTVYAAVLLYLKFYFNFEFENYFQLWGFVYLVIFLFSLIFSISCLINLDMMKAIEIGRKPKLSDSLFNTTKLLIPALPVIILWSAIWFVIVFIEVMLKSKKKDSGTAEFTAENAVRTLVDDQDISLTETFLDAIKKGARMITFTILPAIAWEEAGPTLAIKKGIGVARRNLKEFTVGFILTEAAAVLIFLPVAFIIYAPKETIQFSNEVWYATFMYIAVATGYCLFLEQFFCAEPYLWDLVWQKEALQAEIEDRELPKLHEVRKPCFLDDFNDLEEVLKD
jgi:hypothetical protein